MDSTLNEKEVLFCQLYANGSAPFAGNPAKCYSEAFNDDSSNVKHLAKTLLKRRDTQEYLASISDMDYDDVKYMKRFLTENLVHIIEETSSAEYTDRRGTRLSPAPLRSVAVSAAKALMEIYPVKATQVNKFNFSNEGDGGITFNVIVPDKDKFTQTIQ